MVTHSGTGTNYGGNSPYIYVDPDGNWIHIVVGAVVGAIVGGITGAIKGIREGNFRKALVGSIVGSIIGAASGAAIAATGGAAAGAASGLGAASTFTSATGLATATAVGGSAATAAYAVAAAGASAAWSFAQTAITTKGDFQQAGISAGISFGASIVGSAVGSVTSGLGKFGRATASYMSSVATSYGAAALTSGVNEENWDDILLDASISSVAGIAASYTAGDAITKSAGMGKKEDGARIGGAVGSAGDDAGYKGGDPVKNQVTSVPESPRPMRRAAILIVNHAATKYGHSALVFEDTAGNAFFFSQGVNGGSASGNMSAISGVNQPGGVLLTQVQKPEMMGGGVANFDELVGVATNTNTFGYRYNEALEVSITLEQASQIYENALNIQYEHETGASKYNLYFNNCTDAVQDVLQTGTGIDLPVDYSPSPRRYFEQLRERFEK